MNSRPNQFEPRTVLTGLQSLRWYSGLDVDEIDSRAKGTSLLGGFKWVWDVSAEFPDNKNQCLRFWSREIIFPESTRRLTLDHVIKMILPPSRKTYHTGEVENTLFNISGPLLMRLRPEMNGILGANSSFFPREGLEQFLRHRWLGADRANIERSAA